MGDGRSMVVGLLLLAGASAAAPAFGDEDQHHVAFGVGVGSPDGLAFDVTVFISRHLALRAFGAPPISVPVTVHMDAETLATLGPYKIEEEPLDLDVRGHYGPQFGLDAMILPFGGTFFVSLGFSQRSVSASTAGSSSLHLCPTSNASCGQLPLRPSLQDIPLFTGVDASASVRSVSYMARGAIGWRWDLGDNGYLQLTALGIAKPFSVARDVSVAASLRSPLPAPYNQYAQNATQQLVADRQSAAKTQIVAAIKPYDTAILPDVAIEAGLQF